MVISQNGITDEQIDISNTNDESETDEIADDGLRFLGTKDIAKLMGCSIPVARQIMKRKDFPLVMCGKNLKVMKSEFIKWASQRRV
ncbi:MAG: helix-turn-helix domain-containing protein [Alphaproteobacteria bacterium]|nr:helix-turn-helix domain-containing protein [Alphaproteobacteria bacterium]